MSALPDKEKLLREVQPYRGNWAPRPAGLTPEPAGPDEESVWDYPRPPEVRPAKARARVVFAGETVADSDKALRIVETAGAPVYYFPPEDVIQAAFRETRQLSVCEWKGAAIYYDLVAGNARAAHAAFAYPDPLDDLGMGYARIAGWYAFYAGRVDACYVGDEKATPQPGGLYAGWVTQDIKGPIKGGPGTEHW
ncbi:MAG: DUF427 domain-containing protein [Hyphococcus sp.]